MMLRRIFGHKREEVTEGWRKLHDEELYNLCFSPHIIRVIRSRRMRMVGHIVHMGEVKNLYIIFVRKPEGKRPLGRLRYRWEDNIRMDLRETGW
jgi:hypothetical protein